MFRLCLLSIALLATSFCHAVEHNYFGEESQVEQAPDDNSLGEKESNYLRRRLNLLSKDPKTVELKEGYICSKGKVAWDSRDVLLSELSSFMQAWNERNAFFGREVDPGYGGINPGGNGLYHSFTMWVVLRQLKPIMVVESGVRNGHTSWLIAKATEDFAPLLVRVDPVERGWNGIDGNPNHDKMVDLRGERFMDVSEIDWDKFLKDRKYFITHKQKKESLFIFDDNQDHLKRILHLHKIGVAHAIFDDNYMPGVGPAFSLKDACDGVGHLRASFNYHSGTENELLAPKKCDSHHEKCEELPFDDKWWMRYGLAIEVVLTKYWEGPPLAPLERPYGSIIDYIHNLKKYEGPKRWTEEHSRLVLESTKPPLFDSMKEASEATGLSEQVLQHEGERYLHLAYVNIRVK